MEDPINAAITALKGYREEITGIIEKLEGFNGHKPVAIALESVETKSHRKGGGEGHAVR